VKRSTVLLILAAVLAATTAATLLLIRRQETGATTAEEAAAQIQERIQITNIDPAEVRRIELVSQGRQLRLYRENDAWRIEQADPVELDPAAVEDLVYTFARLDAERVIARSADDTEQFGLDPPKVVGRALLADGGKIELRLGDLTPVRNTYYLMKTGDSTVYAVWANHGMHLSYTPDDLRKRELARITKQTIEYVRIARLGGRGIEMQRVDEAMLQRYPFLLSPYVLIRPYRELKAVAMERLPEFLNRIPPQWKIAAFIEDRPADPSVYGLDPPRAEIRIRDGTSELHLLLGNPAGDSQLYARRAEGSPVFTLEQADLKLLQVEPFELIEKQAFIVYIGYVDAITIRANGESHRIDMIRSGAGTDNRTEFLLDGKPVAEDAFKEFYQSLVSLVVEAEIPSAPPRREHRVLELIYTLNRGEPRLYHLEFVPYDRDFLALYKNGTSEFLISRQQVRSLMQKLKLFAGES